MLGEGIRGERGGGEVVWKRERGEGGSKRRGTRERGTEEDSAHPKTRKSHYWFLLFWFLLLCFFFSSLFLFFFLSSIAADLQFPQNQTSDKNLVRQIEKTPF